jgi:hypothetical protein
MPLVLLALLASLSGLATLVGLPASARAAVEIPAEGACPPYPVDPGGQETGGEDVVPPALRVGELIDPDGLDRLRGYLPQPVWERRQVFFYDGAIVEIGPCHRPYLAAPFFEQATRANAGRATLDEQGNLHGYAGTGLPFVPAEIDESAPDAGWKWAWNYRYRYMGSGFRGDFRIMHVSKRGRKIDRYYGNIFVLPYHGLPGDGEAQNGRKTRLAAGGTFTKPSAARGVSWRQYRPTGTEGDADHSDNIFVWVPDERRVRRAPPTNVDGLFMPAYTRGMSTTGGKLALPDAQVSTPDASIAVTEHWRRGFVGMLFRPNAYRFRFKEVRDVIAPINGVTPGYPVNEERSYGPSGLSVANDRWDVRRAVVLDGQAKGLDSNVGSVQIWLDAQSLAPLYWISRRRNHGILEVGIFVSSYSGPPGSGEGTEETDSGTDEKTPVPDFGVLVPTAQTMFGAGDENWLRESYSLRTDTPTDKEQQELESTTTLTTHGR